MGGLPESGAGEALAGAAPVDRYTDTYEREFLVPQQFYPVFEAIAMLERGEI